MPGGDQLIKGRESWFLWVEGSPSAAENPPHDSRWRAAIAEIAARQPAAVEVELDFLLQPRRFMIDLDNLVRLALDGLRDAGCLARGLVGLDAILATKRLAPPLGLGLTLVRSKAEERPRQLYRSVQLVAESDVIPREGKTDEKRTWREIVRTAWTGELGRGPVALDIAVRTSGSLATVMKPVIDGLEAYLGRGTAGGREFRPLDERIVLLRVRRAPNLPVALRIKAGVPRQSPTLRIAPPEPGYPVMDPEWPYSTDDLERLERRRAWERIYAEAPGWRSD